MPRSQENPNVEFDLVPGEWQLFCPVCEIKIEKCAATNPDCSKCGKRMVIASEPQTGGEKKSRRCANCGATATEAKSCIAGDDGEWFCSVECYDEHERVGCPFETGVEYRRPA